MRSFLVFSTLLLLQACAVPTSYSDLEADTASSTVARNCGPSPKIPHALYFNPDFKHAALTLTFELLPSKKVTDVQVARSSGYPELDAEAVAAVSKWHCLQLDKVKEGERIGVPFLFTMGNDPTPSKSLQVIWAGTYTKKQVEAAEQITGRLIMVPRFDLHESTRKIAALEGTRFGVGYKVDAAHPDEMISLRIVWRFPPEGLVDPKTGQASTLLEREARCRVGDECVLGYSFDAPWMLVPGIWTAEIWLGNDKVASESFEVALP